MVSLFPLLDSRYSSFQEPARPRKKQAMHCVSSVNSSGTVWAGSHPATAPSVHFRNLRCPCAVPLANRQAKLAGKRTGYVHPIPSAVPTGSLETKVLRFAVRNIEPVFQGQ
eukprot:gene16695-biopygen23293